MELNYLLFTAVEFFINIHELSVVLEFNVAGFRQQQTQKSSSDGDAAVQHHGDGVMVDVQELDQRREDAGHSSAHGVQTYTILPTATDLSERSNRKHGIIT